MLKRTLQLNTSACSDVLDKLKQTVTLHKNYQMSDKN